MAEQLRVVLADDVADALRDLAERRGVTVTEVVRRATSTWKYIEDVLDEGGKVLVAEGDRARELAFPWGAETVKEDRP